ncbi:unnamed protein product [Owenia fusiformis]|uniref:Uncharacterized protein n=1 Tax=Owenia fusiformis TaxID=6347 RepID=A0A8S4P9L9_OWEFU|nr:unnamed protein product [Owenia fusiformis]
MIGPLVDDKPLTKMALDFDLKYFLGDLSPVILWFGAISAVIVTVNVFCRLWLFAKAFILSPIFGLGVKFDHYGKWAVVTGCTDGIGKEFALQLAKRGLDIVLISRSPDKLADVSLEIESTYKVKTKTVVADFTRGVDLYDEIKQQIKDLNIGVLVNNVGMSYRLPSRFAELDDGQNNLKNIIDCNLLSTTLMCNMLLPGMVERGKGIVINNASLSGLVPVPMLTMYGATKTAMDYMSKCLQEEYRSKGIIVQSLCPAFVATKLSGLRRTSLFVPSTTRFVQAALCTVGIETTTNGYWAHSLQAFLMLSIPECIMLRLTHFVMEKAGIAERKRLERKKQKST